jgi:hypothetical protein
MTRSMVIYFVLTGICTGLSVVSFSSSAKKALFNEVHWTVIWTVLFIYSIQTSTFVIFFGQLFKRGEYGHSSLDKHQSFPIAVRYFFCFFPNAGLLFCIQVMQQFERRAGTLISLLANRVSHSSSRWHADIQGIVLEYLRLSTLCWLDTFNHVDLFGDVHLSGDLCRTHQSGRVWSGSKMELFLEKILLETKLDYSTVGRDG